MKNKHKLSAQIAIVFLLTSVSLGGALLALESTLVRAEFIEQSLKRQTLAANIVIQYVDNRLKVAEALASSVANTARMLPKDAELVKKVLPQIIDHVPAQQVIAGGGYWPEPGKFSQDVERRSFFWGRDKEGVLQYFDGYNDPKGNGYHHEEWYVPARYKKDSTCYWSKSYVDPYSLQPMVTCTIPMFEDGVFTGVSTIDLRLEGLNDLLTKSTSAFHGYGFILDRNNKLITFPEGNDVRLGGTDAKNAEANEYIDANELAKRMPLFAPITDILDQINRELITATTEENVETLRSQAKAINKDSYQVNDKEAALIAGLLNMPKLHLELMNSGRPFVTKLEHDPLLNKAAYVNVFLLPNTNWKLVTVAPLDGVIAGANRISFEMMFWTAVVILILLTFFYLYLHGILLNPIRAMIQRLQQNTAHEKGVGPVALDETVKNELGLIAFWYNRSNRELFEAKQLADRSNAAKSDFLANMSHELRTPLNSMIGMTDLLREQPHDAATTEILNNVGLAADSLLEIVNDVLDLSKIESDGIELESVPFYPHDALAKTLAPLVPLASAKNLILSSIIKIDPATVAFGDITRVKRIIVNLVGNAIKYTERGAIAVYANIAPQEGKLWLEFKVTDTGIGIAEDKIDRIFDKFNQADNTITRKYGGSGLGLCITRELLHLMGGSIHVRSVLGSGSTFTARIPLARGTPEDMVQFEQFDPSLNYCGTLRPAATKILIAEDHVLNQAFLKRLLPALGLTNFTLVDNGAELQKAYETGNYDIILTDCHMPHVSGYEATTYIRKREQITGSYIPIIAMTANAMMGEEQRCLQVGMDAYIAKPIDRVKLKVILSRWIRFEETQKAVKAAPIMNDHLSLLDMTALRSFTIGSHEEEQEFAEIFARQSEDQLEELVAYCVEGESHGWVEVAHKLKGGAATMGAMRMRELCNQAQLMSKATVAERKAMLLAIRQQFDAVLDELKKRALLKK